MTHTAIKEDVYSKITNKIIADLEKGELTWRKPWSAEHMMGRIQMPMRWNDEPYTGINVIMLWAQAAESGYPTPHWMTFKQAQDMKAHVKKGEKGTMVVYADKIVKAETNNEGEESLRQIPFLKNYTVFNASQIEGLPPAFYDVAEIPPLNNETRIAELETFFASTKAEICHGSPQASYSISNDKINMPPFESFIDAYGYYATLAHELTHWTRHPSRLDRDFGRKKFGDEGYAKEELVAELGSCFLCSDLGLKPELREDHSAYIQSWLEVLQNDKKFIFSAAAHAQRAVWFLSRT